MSNAIRLRPARGEIVAGDIGVYREIDGHAVACVADVIGHGPRAHKVARVIDAYLSTALRPDVLGTLRGLDEHLRGMDGAAVAMCSVDLETGAGRHVALGNVTTQCLPCGRELVSRDGCIGTPGTAARLHDRVTNFFQLEDDHMVMMYSDGIRSGVRRATEPGIASADAAVVAETVLGYYARGHDDAICLAMRFRQ